MSIKNTKVPSGIRSNDVATLRHWLIRWKQLQEITFYINTVRTLAVTKINCGTDSHFELFATKGSC